jgi:hypothetical protein
MDAHACVHPTIDAVLGSCNNCFHPWLSQPGSRDTVLLQAILNCTACAPGKPEALRTSRRLDAIPERGLTRPQRHAKLETYIATFRGRVHRFGALEQVLTAAGSIRKWRWKT